MCGNGVPRASTEDVVASEDDRNREVLRLT
jgi:hypothetical protein